MKLSWKLTLGILACLLLAGGSYVWATELMDSLYAYRSPLHSNPPPPGDSLLPVSAPRPVRQVVVVLIDALRLDTSLETQVMPYLNELRQQGAWATMHSRTPSYSAPGYSVLMTGAWPDLSDGPAMNFPYEEMPTWTQDNLFSSVQRAGLKTAVSGYYWFEKLIPQQAVSASFYTPLEDQTADRQVVDAALPWLRSGDYALALVHLDQVDYAGHHEGGPVDPRWGEAAQRVDGLLREITAEMDFTQDTLLVISDHGQIDRGGHGGQDAVVLLEPFVLAGARVIPGDYGDVEMIDVTPTLAALLGTNIPAVSQGKVHTQMLDLPTEITAALPGAVQAQQDRLLQSYLQAGGYQSAAGQGSNIAAIAEERINQERLPRGLLALVLASLALVLWRRSQNLALLVGLGLLYLLLFNLRYIVIDRLTYSLSSVNDANSLILYCAITALAALLVCWAVLLGVKRPLRLGPGQAAWLGLSLTLVIVSLLALPVLWSYFWNGALISWYLPDFGSLFLGFLALIQVLFVAAWGLILSGLAALLAWRLALK